jgi:hypothetical protein
MTKLGKSYARMVHDHDAGCARVSSFPNTPAFPAFLASPLSEAVAHENRL